MDCRPKIRGGAEMLQLWQRVRVRGRIWITCRLSMPKNVLARKRVSSLSMELYLSKDRFRKVFENTSNLYTLCNYLYIPQDRSNDAISAAVYYDQCTQPTKVRKIIFHLDCIGDTDLADSIMEYVEPPTDSSLTQHHLIPVFQALIGDWEQIDGNIIVPSPRAILFREKFSVHDQPTEAGKYYALYHCDPNWKELSRYLYSARETVALDITRRHIQAIPDTTLIPRNIVRIARLIPLWKNYESRILDIPEELHDEIAKRYYGEKVKLELFTAWLSGHPWPTWEHVRDLMMWLERNGRGREGAAKEVEDKYMHIKKPQPISIPSYSHQVLDDHFPGICFLREPQKVAVQSEPVTISPPGHGVTLKITPNSTNKPVNVSLRTCLFSSVFKYPAGYTPLSAVYHITSDSDFDKDIELTFEHFAELETDKQANEMRFLRAESNESGMYIFTPIESEKFKVNGHRCTISTKQDGFITAGSIPSSKIRKRYTVLCSYTYDTEGVRHAAVAISLDAAVFITHFRKVLEEKWKVPIFHRHKLNVPFNKSSALVVHQHSNLIGWNVKSEMSHSFLSKEDVDHPDFIGYDYPPHVIYDITPSANAQPSILHMAVTVTVPAVEFQMSLETKKYLTETKRKPDLLTLMKLTSHQGDINIIQSSANHYHDIGSLLLNDRYSDRVDVISDNNKGQVTDIMKEIYEEWLTEESNNCSWITLIDCFRQCGLYHLASSIEHHFEPLLPIQDSNDINFSVDDTNHSIRDMPIKVTDWRIWSGTRLFVTVAAPIAAVLLFLFL